MTKKDINPITHTDKISTSILKKIQESDCQNTNHKITLLIFKQEQILEIWLTSDTCKRLINSYLVQLSSTETGPRLYDWEVRLPEGIYSLKLQQDSIIIDYPNDFDNLKAVADNRLLSSNQITFEEVEKQNSIILPSKLLEELRVFLENMDLEKIQLVLVPSDIREGDFFPICSNCPHWVYELYGQLKLTLNTFTH